MDMNINSIIRMFHNKQVKRLVNVYQLKYINGPAQGFGDYIRGCFCLLQIASLLGIQFDMDLTNHPMSKFFLQQENLHNYEIDYLKIAKFENANYIPINAKIFKKNSEGFLLEFINKMNTFNFLKNGNYFLFCNSIPIFDYYPKEARNFIRSKLSPNEAMQQNIRETLIKLNLKPKQYAVIHIRSGDKYMLKNNKLNPFVIRKIIRILTNNMKPGNKYLLLSDNNDIKLILKKVFPHIIIQNTNIVHLGESENPSEAAIMETLIDFFLMAYSFQIVGFSPYNWGSGFSQWCSILYNIPYLQIQVLDYLS